jgi:signal recognition particle GTPase
LAGAVGIGKTTFARRLAAHVESIGDRNVLCVAPTLRAAPNYSLQAVGFNSLCLPTYGTERDESNVRPMLSAYPSFEGILSSYVIIMDDANLLTRDSLDLFLLPYSPSLCWCWHEHQ